MKYLNPVMIAILLSILTISCSSDDDSGDSGTDNQSTFIAPTSIEGNIEEDLLAIWQVVSITEDGKAEELDQCDLQETVSFTEANMYFTQETSNNQEPCELQQFNGRHTIRGNFVDITIGGDSFTKEVIGLNATGLVLRENYRENGRTFVFVETYKKVDVKF